MRRAPPRFLDWAELADEVSLDVPLIAEAVAFLMDRAGRRDEKGARTLAEGLGRLLLALDHAAAMCKRTQMSFDAYAAKASHLIICARNCRPTATNSSRLSSPRSTIRARSRRSTAFPSGRRAAHPASRAMAGRRRVGEVTSLPVDYLAGRRQTPLLPSRPRGGRLDGRAGLTSVAMNSQAALANGAHSGLASPARSEADRPAGNARRNIGGRRLA